MINKEFIRNRIKNLMDQKGLSGYRLSLDLGHSKSYIQSILSRNAMPSMEEFLSLCGKLDVAPKEFFDEDIKDLALVNKLYVLSKTLSEEDLQLLISVAKRMNKEE